MGIMSRISNVFKSNINSILDSVEDPEKILEQNLLDMEKEFLKARESVAKAKAEEIRLSKEIAFKKQELEKWTNNAKAALQSGKEDLARKALVKKQEVATDLQGMEKDFETISTNVEKLTSELGVMQKKIDEAKRKKNLLKSRMQSAKAKKKINEIKSQISGTGTAAFDSFSKMEEKADRMINEADAMESLNSELEQEDLESEFANLNSDASIEDELKKLKEEI